MKLFYIVSGIVIVILLGITAVVFMPNIGENSDLTDSTATTSSETATSTGELSDEERLAIEEKLKDEDTLDLPDDLPQNVPVPEGRDCGVADTLPRSKKDAALDELTCLGEAIMNCEAAYITDNEKGIYLSVPEQGNTGKSCEIRLKFRTPDEIATIETLKTANGELVCPLDALEQFTQESSYPVVTFDEGSEKSSYTVRASLALFNARRDLLNKDKNEPAEDIIRQNCTGNLVTQTAEE